MSIFHGKKCISCDHRGLGVTSKSRLSQHNLKSLNSPFIAESSWEALRAHRCCSVPILAPLRPFCFLSSSCPSLLFYYSPFLLGSLLPSFHPSVLCCTSSFLLSSLCCTSISSLALICLFPFSFLFFFFPHLPWCSSRCQCPVLLSRLPWYLRCFLPVRLLLEPQCSDSAFILFSAPKLFPPTSAVYPAYIWI